MDIGDEELDELYRLGYRAVLRIVRDASDAEDCAQEAVARALARWRRVSAYAEPWVIKVSTNLAIGVVRKQSRLSSRATLADDVTVENDEDLVVGSVDLRSALIRLPARQREALVMRYVAGVPEADVAAAMGCSVGTVKTHTRRGLANLRNQLNRGSAS